MPESSAAILVLLQYLAVPSVAGALAAALFDRLRCALPQDAESASPLRRLGARLRALLFAPRYARHASLLLAGSIGGLANIAIALCAGADARAVADTALAGLLAMVVGQLTHGQSLSATAPGPSAGVYTALQSRIEKRSRTP